MKKAIILMVLGIFLMCSAASAGEYFCVTKQLAGITATKLPWDLLVIVVKKDNSKVAPLIMRLVRENEMVLIPPGVRVKILEEYPNRPGLVRAIINGKEGFTLMCYLDCSGNKEENR